MLHEELLSLLCPVRRARMVVSSEVFLFARIEMRSTSFLFILFNRMTVGDMKGARSTYTQSPKGTYSPTVNLLCNQRNTCI